MWTEETRLIEEISGLVLKKPAEQAADGAAWPSRVEASRGICGALTLSASRHGAPELARVDRRQALEASQTARLGTSDA